MTICKLLFFLVLNKKHSFDIKNDLNWKKNLNQVWIQILSPGRRQQVLSRWMRGLKDTNDIKQKMGFDQLQVVFFGSENKNVPFI